MQKIKPLLLSGAVSLLSCVVPTETPLHLGDHTSALRRYVRELSDPASVHRERFPLGTPAPPLRTVKGFIHLFEVLKPHLPEQARRVLMDAFVYHLRAHYVPGSPEWHRQRRSTTQKVNEKVERTWSSLLGSARAHIRSVLPVAVSVEYVAPGVPRVVGGGRGERSAPPEIKGLPELLECDEVPTPDDSAGSVELLEVDMSCEWPRKEVVFNEVVSDEQLEQLWCSAPDVREAFPGTSYQSCREGFNAPWYLATPGSSTPTDANVTV